LGNVLRGVPLNPDGKFALTFFTNFSPRGNVGILDWFTVSVALFMLITFAAHGATVLVLKTEGPVHERSLRIADTLWKIVLALLVIVTVESWWIRPEVFSGMLHQPFGWLGLVSVFGGIMAAFTGLRSKREFRAVIGSSAFVAGLMIAGAAGVFPIMLHSTLAPRDSLSAYQNAAASHGLAIALVWWPLALILSVAYVLFISRHYVGKIKLTDEDQNAC
jgi:cytochrome d ubiquinol oxidase subunit II